MMKTLFAVFPSLLLFLSACTANVGDKTPSALVGDFGTCSDGTVAKIITLENSNGVKARISNYGATLVSLEVPHRNGSFSDVVLGFKNVADYERQKAYYGATLGRFGARIRDAKFSLDGKEYRLTLNESRFNTCLHGGKNAFDKRIWNFECGSDANSSYVEFSLLSPDGDNGFPGNLNVSVRFTLDNDNALTMRYQAKTDKPTPVNLSNHIYWNLRGEGNGDVLSHILKINADFYTPHYKKNLIPTGEIATVSNTPFDFRKEMAIGARVEDAFPQLRINNGYSHNYVLNKSGKSGDRVPEFAFSLFEPDSGRLMEVYTTQVGLLFHSGNGINDAVKSKSGAAYKKYSGAVFEPQHFCDSPNIPNFPNTILRPQERYDEVSVWKFSVKK